MSFNDFMEGNEVAAEAAVRAGCRSYFFYPLTPSSEIGEYMAKRMPEVGGELLQMESEVSVINAVYGAGATGTLAMTGTSGCGASLMMEGLSYMCMAQIPAVLVNVMRSGPGLGSLVSTQLDYNQFVKGGGHGGYHIPVYTPGTIQEIADITYKAFEVSQKYRTPVGILYEGVTGQMREKVEFPEMKEVPERAAWAATGAKGRKANKFVTGFGEKIGGQLTLLKEKWDRMEGELPEWEEYETEDADVILTAFGMVSRICKSAVKLARRDGLRVGLLRPKTVWPFPSKAYERHAERGAQFLTVEMNFGQMYEDVTMAVGSKKQSHFMDNIPSTMPREESILAEVKKIMEEAN